MHALHHTVLNPAAEFLYSPRVVELFSDLRHAGLTDASVAVSVGSKAQGTAVSLQLAISESRISDMRFLAYGCPYFLAGCEWLCRTMVGQSTAVLIDWRWRDLEASLAAPAAKRAHWLLLDDAVRKLVHQLR